MPPDDAVAVKAEGGIVMDVVGVDRRGYVVNGSFGNVIENDV